jgi:zinc/manganese transport system substrate-binding protein
MHRYIFLAFLLTISLPAQAELRVFTCEPEWEALAVEIGGDLVKTDSATHALQDPHYIQARPSLIARLRKADLLVCSGANLEIGWLPQLLSKANNPGVRPGSNGYFEASSFVPRLDVPGSIDRAKGDMHPQGNPHVQVNPHNMLIVAQALAERMAQLDPANADRYRQGGVSFLERWQEAIAAWEDRAAVLRGKRVVAHHKSWVYLQNWLGLVEVATLEPVPGIPPTANHLGELLRMFGDQGSNADFIIRAPYQSAKASEWLSERTGIPALALPLTVGGSDGATDLFNLFDDILDRLLEAES